MWNLSPATRHRLRQVLTAITEAEVADELGRDDLVGVPLLAETAEVLERRLLGMPAHFAAGMVVLTLLFDRAAVLTDGAPYRALPLRKRRAALARLRGRPLGPLGNFTTFFDKMAPFIFWSQIEEYGKIQAVLGEGAS
ncbi:MAG: hypothetical protein EXR71_16725 [Myxococcales bacterium]|nr:hypothetical protein [Myxococcales bacterium]